jgi:hypothetical protein
MRITLESTTQIVEVNGVPARVWEGTTESGIPVSALITRLAVERTQDTAQFEAELRECRAPKAVPFDTNGPWPMRLVL